MSLNTLEKMERLLEIAEREGISVRNEWLGGVRGGLVRIGACPVLFVDDSLSVTEQFDQTKSSLAQLDWTDTEWRSEMEELLNIVPRMA